MEISEPLDPETLKGYAEEVKKRIEEQKEKSAEETFLRSSLRRSERLKAIENNRRLIRQKKFDKPEINQAFESDEVIPSKSELAELVRYLQTKIHAGPPDEDSAQWAWLLSVLVDPLLPGAFALHDQVAQSYERCARIMQNEPRNRWPILPGSAYDVLSAVQTLLRTTILRYSVISDVHTMNSASLLCTLLDNPLIRNLCVAMDGLSNVWLFEDAEPDLPPEDEVETAEPVDPTIEASPVPGCYATLAYDDQGRDSYSDQGVRLKYVVLQKRENEFLGATVSVSGRSVLIARVVNGGLVQKTNLLHQGDELLSVNGIELIGKDLNTATNILASLHGQITLLVAPATEPPVKPISNGIINLRALFSYEPSEDRQFACHELGLPFSKGDILHVTNHHDPDWWQAYRNDPDTGITGAVGTLAGLIPSPLFQRQRCVMRLQSLFNSSPKEIEWEEEPSELEQDVGDEKPSRRFFGIKLPFGFGKADVPNTNLPETNPDLSETESSDSLPTMLLVNSALISSIYADRISDHRSRSPSQQPTEDAIEEWSAAGPVWSQHGFELNPHTRNRGLNRKRSSKKKTPCWKKFRGEKRVGVKNRFPLVSVGPDPTTLNDSDPVAWLDREVSTGYLPHFMLWTYEPVAQYIPQPLRRRPFVFVGPAHVGRHHLMQRLIQSDPNRFCGVPITTTNPKIKSDASVTYEHMTLEQFEEERKRGAFIEYGVFNRARYGTSGQAVRNLVEAGKVCCLALRPDSLRKLRSSGLMPYVIFISPPERVDELRRIQKLMGLKASCSDFELASCIEASRKMELRFGHFFDVAMVPEDLESAVAELEAMATRLAREPSWIPRYWVAT